VDAMDGEGGEDCAGKEGGVAEGAEEGVGSGRGGEDFGESVDCAVSFREVERKPAAEGLQGGDW
jgi:hypothetical protein